MSEDDKEILLRTANEKRRVEAGPGQTPGDFATWHAALKDEVAYGTGLLASFKIVASWPGRVIRWTLGRAPDTRDSEQIAEEFLQVVEARVQRDGAEHMEAHIERARDAAMERVPTHYRRKVLERILDREERAAELDGAPTAESKELEATREERRHRGWSLLSGRGPSGRER
jgi:hypothetical protein